MSQSHNSTDTQGLLQSMLQRLKLQSGRDAQTFLQTSVPITAASTWKQDGERGASNLQKVNNSPVNGFEYGINGVPSKEFGISTADRNFGLECEEMQHPGHGCQMDMGLISSPSQQVNIDKDSGENRVLGQVTLPGINPTVTGQQFPAISLKDTNMTSFEKTDGDRVSFGASAMTRAVPTLGQNQVQDPGFTPRVYMWSLKPTDANLDMESQENKMLHEGNGQLGALAQRKGMQFVSGSQKTTNSTSRRKQQSAENKTRRWTQKIKERWLDRSGSFGKKGKEGGGGVNQKSEQGTELVMPENLNNPSNKERERTPLSLDSSDPSEAPSMPTEDSTLEGRIRSSNDFEFGLGSFSLLEEIVTGQEWARFLNPNLAATSTNQSPPEEPLSQLKIPSNPHDSSGSPLILNRNGGGNNPWSFTDTESPPVSDLRMAQISPDAFLPVGIGISEGKQQQQHVHREADLSEPMEDGQCGVRGRGQQCRPPSFVEMQPADIVDNSALKRVHLNRKRHHQSAERRDERLPTEKISDGKEAGRVEGSISPLSFTGSHANDGTGQSQLDVFLPLYTLNSSPTTLSPSSFNSCVPAPRGVLKHSISQDSESSMETVTKRRRVEENRRVHFSEEVETIASPELDENVSDSEEESGAEDDSVTEQECEAEPAAAAAAEVSPARRPALPAWIQALKFRNTGRKHR